MCYVTEAVLVAYACRCSAEDLDNERGAVMEEWRSGKNAAGRVQEAQWKLVMQGTKVQPCCESDVRVFATDASAEREGVSFCIFTPPKRFL